MGSFFFCDHICPRAFIFASYESGSSDKGCYVHECGIANRSKSIGPIKKRFGTTRGNCLRYILKKYFLARGPYPCGRISLLSRKMAEIGHYRICAGGFDNHARIQNLILDSSSSEYSNWSTCDLYRHISPLLAIFQIRDIGYFDENQ